MEYNRNSFSISFVNNIQWQCIFFFRIANICVRIHSLTPLETLRTLLMACFLRLASDLSSAWHLDLSHSVCCVFTECFIVLGLFQTDSTVTRTVESNSSLTWTSIFVTLYLYSRGTGAVDWSMSDDVTLWTVWKKPSRHSAASYFLCGNSLHRWCCGNKNQDFVRAGRQSGNVVSCLCMAVWRFFKSQLGPFFVEGMCMRGCPRVLSRTSSNHPKTCMLG